MKLEEFNDWFKIWRRILWDLNIAIMNARYLLTLHRNEIDKAKDYGFFAYHTSQLRFIVVIQACKIFDNSSNQKRNVNKLFNKLLNEKIDNSFLKQLEDNKSKKTAFKNKNQLIQEVRILQKRLNEKADLINRIVLDRNKIYAHTDPENQKGDYSWEELEQLVNLSNKIYNDIYGGVYNSKTLFDLIPGYSVAEVIQKLVK